MLGTDEDRPLVVHIYVDNLEVVAVRSIVLRGGTGAENVEAHVGSALSDRLMCVTSQERMYSTLISSANQVMAVYELHGA